MRLTNNQYKQLLNTSLTYKQNKYHNKKVIIDGIKFDSIKESNRWLQLKQLERAGIITDLKRQQPFLLIDTIYYKGITYKKTQYYADFVYMENNKLVVEDVKSEATKKDKVYILKKKMLLSKYTNIDFREIL